MQKTGNEKGGDYSLQIETKCKNKKSSWCWGAKIAPSSLALQPVSLIRLHCVCCSHS